MRKIFGEVWRKGGQPKMSDHLRLCNRQEQDVVCKPFQEQGWDGEAELTIGRRLNYQEVLGRGCRKKEHSSQGLREHLMKSC